jgi:hypothetical protein
MIWPKGGRSDGEIDADAVAVARGVRWGVSVATGIVVAGSSWLCSGDFAGEPDIDSEGDSEIVAVTDPAGDIDPGLVAFGDIVAGIVWQLAGRA